MSSLNSQTKRDDKSYVKFCRAHTHPARCRTPSFAKGCSRLGPTRFLVFISRKVCTIVMNPAQSTNMNVLESVQGRQRLAFRALFCVVLHNRGRMRHFSRIVTQDTTCQSQHARAKARTKHDRVRCLTQTQHMRRRRIVRQGHLKK